MNFLSPRGMSDYMKEQKIQEMKGIVRGLIMWFIFCIIFFKLGGFCVDLPDTDPYAAQKERLSYLIIFNSAVASALIVVFKAYIWEFEKSLKESKMGYNKAETYYTTSETDYNKPEIDYNKPETDYRDMGGCI